MRGQEESTSYQLIILARRSELTAPSLARNPNKNKE